jgi:hypothetical protein
MEIQQTFSNTTVSNFIGQTSSLTAVHRALQRKSVWKDSDKTKFKTSLKNNWAVTCVSIADLESSLNRAKMENNLKDIEFFSELINDEYKYVSIDGNNRTQYLVSEYGKYINNFRSATDEIKKILNKNINVCITYNATKYDLHQMILGANSGNPHNEAEKRNAIEGVISDYIRKISDKFISLSSKIKSIKTGMVRMLDDEMYSYFLYFHKHSVSSMKSKNLEDMYRTETKVGDMNLFERRLKNWGKIIERFIEIDTLYYTTSKGKSKKSKESVGKSFTYNLFFFLTELSRKHNYRLNEEKIFEFTEKYRELENERIKKHTNLETKVCYWEEINRSVTSKIDKKVKMILDDFGDDINNYFFKLDENRNFSKNDKIVKWVETDGIIERPDGSIIEVTGTQLLYGECVDSGHIVPFNKGGNDEYDNMQLEISSDNREKGDRY